ncbi:MAG TPA: dihydroneopterin aldolase [Candidatus Nanopelagicales bacterium]|nr:dihydroneopterin aldolase [Candidatus Nanopelagicales bacterium]
MSTWPDGLDRVSVHGISARGFHGVFEHEKRDGQTFSVDVVLGVDTRAAAASDDLADTVDYGAVAAAVVAEIEGPSLDLVEALAQRVADACLAFDGVQAVEVSVHKPEAPVGVPFTDVVVTIVRSR